MASLLEILLGTPYWVWILLAYLIFSGVQALKERKNVPLYRLFVMPIVFIVWSMFSIYKKAVLTLIAWLVLLPIGIVIGYYIRSKSKFFIDKQTKLMHLKGSFIPLLLSIIFFSIKYCFGVAYAINPELKLNVMIIGSDAMLSGLISGMSLGRLLKILHKYLAM